MSKVAKDSVPDGWVALADPNTDGKHMAHVVLNATQVAPTGQQANGIVDAVMLSDARASGVEKIMPPHCPKSFVEQSSGEPPSLLPTEESNTRSDELPSRMED